MCGITGFFDFNCHSTETTLISMTDILHHRGPDDSGYYIDQREKVHIGLGHRRLSVLDLSPHGHQPMIFQNLVITYNGEIYNFKEIREELTRYGYIFESNTDTEVVLKAYHRWGREMVHRFNGMFALALYDKTAQKVLLFRDRAGVKPLYWYFKNDLFLFASELKSFHQHPNFQKELSNDGLALFLQYGYIPQPHTIFTNCYKLNGGYFLEVDLQNKKIIDTKYWDVLDYYSKPKLQISEQEAIDETEKILKSAFEYRMVADVPVGIFLSGGYDSSLVTAILQANRTEKLKTFTIGFYEKEYNEADYAKSIAEYLGTDHTEYYCTQQDLRDVFKQLPEIWDEPISDSSTISTILVSRLARKQVTVSLSADGGDEAFGGYNKYLEIYKRIYTITKTPYLFRILMQQILSNSITHYIGDKFGMANAKERLNRLSYMFKYNKDNMLSFHDSTYYIPDLYDLLRNPFKVVPTGFDEHINSNWLDNLLAIDYKTYQADDILTKIDRATMSVSLEGREPLLDYRIIEYVARLNPALKINKGDKKYILKQIAHKYIPKELLDRPKKGFSVPVYQWFKEDLKEYFLYYLEKEKLEKDCIFNVDKIIDLKERYFAGKKIFWGRLWNLFMFETWKERWL